MSCRNPIEMDKKRVILSSFIFIPLLTYASAAMTGCSVSLSFSFIHVLRGMLGLICIIGLAFLFSSNRRAVSWKLVLYGLLLQLALALCVLYIPFVQQGFELLARCFIHTLGFAEAGILFLFKSLTSGQLEPSMATFAVTILPTIIFFSALTSILFYLGLIQKVVLFLSRGMTRLFKIGGAESLSVAGNIFLGQTESPLMIKAYLSRMNRSEMLLVMAGGMATLAGGVLAVYIKVLGGGDPVQELFFAKHLITASVMAAPGVVVISKILIPQNESLGEGVNPERQLAGKNLLDAISNGTTDGIRLAVNVGGMLLVFIALIAMVNYFLLKLGDFTGMNTWIVSVTDGNYQVLSLQLILGYLFAPLMWVIGIVTPDMDLVGRVLGEKIILTEFIGYLSLADLNTAHAFSDPRSAIMATYVLCGFANFASIGIQIGGIGALAPSKRLMLTQLGPKALLAGTLASLLSASFIGMLL